MICDHLRNLRTSQLKLLQSAKVLLNCQLTKKGMTVPHQGHDPSLAPQAASPSAPSTLALRPRRPSGSRPKATRWSKRLVGKPFLALAATAATLGVLEGVVRVMSITPEVIPIEVTSDQGMCMRSDNQFLSFEMKPNYRNDQADSMADFPQTNSDGLRDIEHSRDKPPGVQRVALVGDSVVAGFGVRDLDALMSRQLERLYPPGNVQVLNVAVTGYCTRAEVELLKVKGLPYDPEHVILVFVENDFDNFNRQARGIGGVAQRPAMVNTLYRNSDLFRLASLRLNWFGYGVETDPLHWNHRAVGDNNVVDGLEALKQLSVERDFDAVVAVWPTFTNDAIIDSDKMRLGDGTDALIIEQLAHQHGFPVCRLSQHFRDIWQSTAPTENPRLRYTTGDEMHPSEEGHRIAALIFKDVLSGQRLAGPPSTGLATQVLRTASDSAKRRGDEKPNYALDHLERAKRLADAGKTDQALEEYRTVIGMSPKYAVNAHNDVGLILADQGELEKAIDHFRQALKHAPDFHIAHTNLANALLAQHQWDEAIEHYRQALAARPEYAPAHNNLGVALQSQGRLPEAIHHFRLAVDLSPPDANIYTRYGSALARANRPADAIVQFSKGLAIKPDHAELHFHLGEAYAALGNVEKALEYLRRAKELDPENRDIRSSLRKYEGQRTKD